MIEIICKAIKDRRIIEFYYNNLYRVVEPHTLGINTKHNKVLSAYQIEGENNHIDVPGWVLFKLEKISNLNVLDRRFESPRPEYRINDSRMLTIYCEL